ncbi:MAG TPA: deoxyribonuclease IV [Mycobacteriales bacterium]|jgi:deoxyribonuclease-4|nr:deoxyribonuclease IV [Mycobacteriales bacterium]
MQEIGAHVDQSDPVTEGADRKADVVQFFLGDPQSWKAPVLPPVDVSGLSFFVHAPYVINVASSNNKIRIPSRKILDNHVAAATSVGARGLVVHGGHVTKGEDPADGVANWVKTLERATLTLPLLIENTAGGDFAMARHLDAIARLWDAIGHFDGVGFCLDTCHFHAGGEDLVTVVERVRAITGRIDLVHCNDSRDAWNSGADRHASLGTGQIDLDVLLGVVRAAGCPVVVETPRDGQADDIALLRERL